MTRFIIFRHGETDWNKEGRAQGWIDIPINHTGKEQAEKLAKRLAKEKIDHFYSSPLKRAYETATIINQHHNKELIMLDDLKEITYGVLEGKTREENKKLYPWFEWHNDEHRKQLQMETITEWKEKLENETIPMLLEKHPNQTVMLSTHGAKMQILLHTFGFDKEEIFATKLYNCGVTILEKNNSTINIICHNDGTHLEEL